MAKEQRKLLRKIRAYKTKKLRQYKMQGLSHNEVLNKIKNDKYLYYCMQVEEWGVKSDTTSTRKLTTYGCIKGRYGVLLG